MLVENSISIWYNEVVEIDKSEFDGEKMKTYTICGSMKFEKEMQDIAFSLEINNGWNIIQCVYNAANAKISSEELDMLAKLHYAKIDISDGIYVVNIGGYIGESVSKEIEYAQSKGKEIIFHC